MKISEARTILGIDSDEAPRRFLETISPARERLAEMVRSAPNETLALRFQDELVEFDQALAALREHAEATEAAAAEQPAAGKLGRRIALFGLPLLIAAAAGAWIYLKIEDDRRLAARSRIIELEQQGAAFIEDRRWPEAEQAYLEIDRILPGAETARLGLRTIEAGMVEERNQFLGYWMGEARTALDGGFWDDAETAVAMVIARIPGDNEALSLRLEIVEARAAAALAAPLAAARALLDGGEWDAALAAARAILADYPEDPDARALALEAAAGRERMVADLAAAREFLALAKAADRGEFDEEALEWLRAAAALAPQDPEIIATLAQMESYVRTLHVPDEFATLTEAIAEARENDRILIGEGTWSGPFFIDVAVDLQGASAASTILSCEADVGSAITFGPGVRGARVGGITFRHEAFDPGPERFSAVLVRGGEVTFADCRFTDASGHGLLVVEGGQAGAGRCRFSGNGWNGIAASGAGSLLDIRECEVIENIGHGIESWEGASLVLNRNRCSANVGNGIHAGDGTASVAIEGNQLVGNREFGLVIGDVAAGRVAENVARGNLLGGFVVHAAAVIGLAGNQAVNNAGPGIVLERGLAAADFSANSATGNAGAQVLADVDLSSPKDDAADEVDDE